MTCSGAVQTRAIVQLRFAALSIFVQHGFRAVLLATLTAILQRCGQRRPARQKNLDRFSKETRAAWARPPSKQLRALISSPP
jgi:hypothetical protein